ncbi:MAG: putative zinc protease [Firmicutes bacterium]|nr:putative zinc protease [candidate division NPL-UPA2 bacterium]
MQVTKLDSGLRVASEHIPHVQTVTIGFWVRCGTFAESSDEMGLSHFLEHMFFKGTQSRSARDIVEAFDDVGGELNAYTAKEYTCFFAKVMDEHLPLAVEVLSDMLTRPLFAEEDLEREKQIVLEEISLYEDAPDELIHDKLADAIWPHHPLGRPILGTRESITSITPHSLRQFYAKHYCPENVVIAACGHLSHEELVRLVEASCSLGSQGVCVSDFADNLPYSERISVIERPIEQLHLCLGFPGLSWRDKDIYAMNIMNNIFGAGMSSRIFQGIREELGLAYSIYSYSASFVSAGYFAVYAGLSARNTATLLKTVGRELLAMKNAPVSAVEISRARQQVKGALVMGLESTANRMSRMGRGLLLIGRVMDTAEILERIEAVTLEDVQSLAKRVFALDQLTVCALGPTAMLPNLVEALRDN